MAKEGPKKGYLAVAESFFKRNKKAMDICSKQ